MLTPTPAIIVAVKGTFVYQFSRGELERFQEVAQKCQDIERILAEQLPALEKLAHKQE